MRAPGDRSRRCATGGRRRAWGIALLGAMVGLAGGARAQDGFQFSIRVPAAGYAAGQPVVLDWTLVNRTARAWQVLSCAGDCPAITVRLARADGSAARVFQLAVPGTATQPGFATLAPGAALHRRVDLLGFAEAAGRALRPGAYVLQARYGFAAYGYVAAPGQPPMWPGAADAAPVRLVIGAP